MRPVGVRRKNTAFTLIELLVVISIIALLVSILLPSLTKAKELARSVLCLANLHSMVLATNQYANENDDQYPLATWDNMMTNWDFSYDALGNPIPGLLWQAGENMKVQQCPSYEGESTFGNDPYTGYNYNTSYVGRGQWEIIQPPAGLEDIQDPSHCALFGDGQWANGANKFMRPPGPDPIYDTDSTRLLGGTQGYRHLGKTNVVWADGSAVSWGKRHAATTDGRPTAEGTGFLSSDNSLYDLK